MNTSVRTQKLYSLLLFVVFSCILISCAKGVGSKRQVQPRGFDSAQAEQKAADQKTQEQKQAYADLNKLGINVDDEVSSQISLNELSNNKKKLEAVQYFLERYIFLGKDILVLSKKNRTFVLQNKAAVTSSIERAERIKSFCDEKIKNLRN